MWAIGLLRDPAVQFSTANGAVEQRRAYWRTKYTNDPSDVVCLSARMHTSCLHTTQLADFLQDFPHAVQRADALDQTLSVNSSSISSHYTDLVALAARQTMAATELTVGSDLSDVKMFMKDIGTSG